MIIRSAAVLSVALVVPGALAGQQLTAAERAAAVATVWAEARYNFAYWDRVRADWDSALTANLKLTPDAQSDLLFYRRLRRLVALLGDGQAAVIPPAHVRSRIARPPLLIASVGRRPFILDYAENDEMRVARPERLAEIISVQGIPAEAWIRDSVLPEIAAATAPDRWLRAVRWMLQGEKGSLLQLALRLPGGAQRGVSVTRSVSLNDRWPLELPEVQVDFLPDGVVLARINSLADDDVAARLDHALPDFSRVTGLILDLRHSSDGQSEIGYRILARLTNAPFPAARWRTPAYRAVFRAWHLGDSASSWYGPPPAIVAPRTDLPPFGGPIAVLASNGTAGAAEDFLVAFRNTGRGVIVGETSAGSPGEPIEIALPKNWAVRFSVTRHAFPDGEEFAGTGIKPEFPVAVLVADVLAGKDAAVDRARQYVSGKR